MPRALLEVIVQTLADARAAARGGADRLEVVRAIDDGGLTPPLALVREIAGEVALPLRVMIRENAGYTTHTAELTTMRHAAAALAESKVDGLVIGFARAGKLELEHLSNVLGEAPDANITFHRAFDQLSDPVAAIGALAGVPRVDRILTSGGGGSAEARAARLGAYQECAGPHLTILAGGGVDEEMLVTLAGIDSIREVHVGRAARADGRPAGVVSSARVERLREILERWRS